MDFHTDWTISTGSVPGLLHTRLHRNNQDAVALQRGDTYLAVSVCDGCSSGRFSEVGAQLMARWLVTRGAQLLLPHLETDSAGVLDTLAEALCDYLGRVVDGIVSPEVARAHAVGDYLLSTFLLTVMTPTKTIIVGLGDGLFSVNQSTHVLDAGPLNAPNYLGYRLLDLPGLSQNDLTPSVLYEGKTSDISSLIIASDGARELHLPKEAIAESEELPVDLSGFETAGCFGRNPSLLQKRLNVLSRRPCTLIDDTTLALFRRREDHSWIS